MALNKISIDNIVIVFLSVIIIYCSWEFYNLELDNLDMGAVNLTPVAQIVDVKNTVKRKFSQGTVWRSLSNGQEIMADDKIYTYANSELEIKFANGNKVLVKENTLFIVNSDNDKSKLNVINGQVSLDLKAENSNLLLKLKDKEVELKSGKGKIDIVSNKKSSSLSVKEGQVDIGSKNSNKTTKLEAGEIAAVAQGIGEGAKFVGETVIDGVSLVGGGVVSGVEMVGKGAFKTVEVVGKGVVTTAKVATNTVFKILTFNQLELFTEEAPSLMTPEDYSELTTHTSSKVVAFSWELSESPLNKMQLQISKDRDFEKVYKKINLKNTNKVKVKLPIGEYWWRIIATNKNKEEVHSEVYIFSIVKESK